MTDIGLFIQLKTAESHETVSIAVEPPQCSTDRIDSDDSNTGNFTADMT